MNTNRNAQVLDSHPAMAQFGRTVVCAFAAVALTVVLLGEVGKSPAQAAQRAAAEQASEYVVL
ncbi:MAG TPA: hypothetical protein VKC11_05605 [Steroidobacteraceae bacterium]|nr:hypothetical protein [Steroidobacteraceae bacterium]